MLELTKISWEMTPQVGDRVVAKSWYDPTYEREGVIIKIEPDVMTHTDVYVIRDDEGNEFSAFAEQTRLASLWEESPYRFAPGDKVRIHSPFETIDGTIDKAGISSDGRFYVVRDDNGDPHVVDEDHLEPGESSLKLI